MRPPWLLPFLEHLESDNKRISSVEQSSLAPSTEARIPCGLFVIDYLDNRVPVSREVLETLMNMAEAGNKLKMGTTKNPQGLEVLEMLSSA